MFSLEDIPQLLEVWQRTGGVAGSDWDAYRHAHMRLPDWFRPGLDPWSAAYRDQQHRLWQAITDVHRPYDAGEDEQDFGWDSVDAVRRPGFYQWRHPDAIERAADHLFATSMLLKHCGLKPGDRALEYGAGFAQSALALARMGVEVDTVDISPRFCQYVQQQAEFFQVPLHPHQGRFGMNPRPGQPYDLIWFYESFHHCLEFMDVVPKLAGMLSPGGRIILGGEPIVEKPYEAVPYPWGVRLHSEVAVVMRQTRWFELGFTEAFLFELFTKAGLIGNRVDCEQSVFGKQFVFHSPNLAAVDG
jgi:SAM-dependent methyltransferase